MNSETPPSSNDPRRAADRTRYTCLAWIENSESGAISGIARLVDISPHGIGLVLATDVPTGTRLMVELLLPGSLRLRANGEVVHVTRQDNGQIRVGVQLDSAPALVETKDKGEDAWRT